MRWHNTHKHTCKRERPWTICIPKKIYKHIYFVGRSRTHAHLQLYAECVEVDGEWRLFNLDNEFWKNPNTHDTRNDIQNEYFWCYFEAALVLFIIRDCYEYEVSNGAQIIVFGSMWRPHYMPCCDQLKIWNWNFLISLLAICFLLFISTPNIAYKHPFLFIMVEHFW